ncbi:MAG: carboxypeptidase-like regulatory domain-containing protein [Acidobacteriota bacterium]
MVIASAYSDIDCTALPTGPFSGQATGIRSTVTTVLGAATTTVADTGPLPSAGGSITATTLTGTIPNLITTGAITATTSGSGNSSQSTATVNDTNLTVGGNIITADVLTANSQCTCSVTGVPSCTGSSVITNLRVNGLAITVTGAPNQTITATVATVTTTIIINEQTPSPPSGNSITVNALHVIVTDSLTNTTTDVVIASAHSDINCNVTTAAPVSISGRVISPFGRGLAGARIVLTNSIGEKRIAVTNPFGYFSFKEIGSGETYIVEITHKSYNFTPQVLLVTNDLTELNFTALPYGKSGGKSRFIPAN